MTKPQKSLSFHPKLLRQIRDGRKTQTRRPINPQPHDYIDELHGGDLSGRAPYNIRNDDDCVVGYGFQSEDEFFKSKFVPGDRVWIQTPYSTRYDEEFNQTYWSVEGFGFTTTHGRATTEKDGNPKRDGRHPGMFMPFWLSQDLGIPIITITKVRVERLHDISNNDAIEEGCDGERCYAGHGNIIEREPCEEFQELWQSIYGEESWRNNPWVWAFNFTVEKD